ncbi:MAG: hypothetical protein IPJ74_00310 [Saprospiraceae bacterium]|nr:hypothetical protein [Saprospiraceae bacterium]
MYQLDITPFGDFEKFSLHNPVSGNRLDLVPAFGACVLDLQIAGQSILDGYQTPEEMLINKWGKNTVMFPFPNRLQDGKYEWLGKTHQLPINDADTGNALHGFGRKKEMRVEEIETEENFAAITCLYSSQGEEVGYPFAFTFAISFRIEDTGNVEVELLFQNDDEQPIPVGFGWHPYFQLADTIDQMELQLPAAEMIEVNNRLIPTGKRYLYNYFLNIKPIDSTILDNCFALSSEQNKAQVTLRGERGILNYWQEMGDHKFNFLQIFTPPHRKSIAIEAMTCNINAFNNKEGLITLQPGAHAHARFGFSFESVK